MADIVDKQYKIIAIIVALITAGTLDTSFITMDNDVEPPASLPVIVVALNTSKPENLAGGGTGFTDFNLRLKIAQSIDNAGTVKLANEFVIDALETIIAQQDMQANFGQAEHQNLNIKPYNCSGVEIPMQLF